ncbi:hypothetical protein [Rhizobiales bacterium 3FA27D7]|uniref:hypothetical protein n=1 Tax=Mesorhizobium sp. 2RAF21 TaxID=3232995 RepID=UPI0010F669CE
MQPFIGSSALETPCGGETNFGLLPEVAGEAVANNLLLHLGVGGQVRVCCCISRDLADDSGDRLLIVQQVKEDLIGLPDFAHVGLHRLATYRPSSCVPAKFRP